MKAFPLFSQAAARLDVPYLYLTWQSLHFIFLEPQRSLFWKLHGYFKVGKYNSYVPVEIDEKKTFFLPSFSKMVIDGGNMVWEHILKSQWQEMRLGR